MTQIDEARERREFEAIYETWDLARFQRPEPGFNYRDGRTQTAWDAWMNRAAAPAAEPTQPVAWMWAYDSVGHAETNKKVFTPTSEPTQHLRNVFARGPWPVYAAEPAQSNHAVAPPAVSAAEGDDPHKWLEEQGFYELMQAYRHAREPASVVASFAAVKAEIRGWLVAWNEGYTHYRDRLIDALNMRDELREAIEATSSPRDRDSLTESEPALVQAARAHIESLDAYDGDLVPINRTRGTAAKLRAALPPELGD